VEEYTSDAVARGRPHDVSRDLHAFRKSWAERRDGTTTDVVVPFSAFSSKLDFQSAASANCILLKTSKCTASPRRDGQRKITAMPMHQERTPVTRLTSKLKHMVGESGLPLSPLT